MTTERQDQSRNDPAHHYARIRAMLSEVIHHARDDVDAVDDPKARALFETTAEVLAGLCRAYEHAAAKSEPAWR